MKEVLNMCEFFSLVSDTKGNPYFDYEIRRKIIAGELNFATDSHSSIIEHFFGKESDTRAFHQSGRRFNQYEYNPLTKVFKTDQINASDDSEAIKEFCINLDFKTIVPELQIKGIINPKNIIHGDYVNDSEKALLMMWDSVWASVRASVGASVRASVGDSVWDSVWASVRASVGASVRASVWAYISDFFTIANWKYVTHEPDKNPFQPCIDLWMLGLVPSFDGKTWRLHNMSNNAEVIYEWVK
jgi:hypothetical protein